MGRKKSAKKGNQKKGAARSLLQSRTILCRHMRHTSTSDSIKSTHQQCSAKDCYNSQPSVLCLHCYKLFCQGSFKVSALSSKPNHCFRHSHESNHRIFLHLETASIFCIACKAVVILPDDYPLLSKIDELVESFKQLPAAIQPPTEPQDTTPDSHPTLFQDAEGLEEDSDLEGDGVDQHLTTTSKSSGGFTTHVNGAISGDQCSHDMKEALRDTDKVLPRPIPLQNVGNSCYANSCYQAWRSLHTAQELAISHPPVPDLVALTHLVQHRPISMRALGRSIARQPLFAGRIRHGQQQDAHEFLVCLLESMPQMWSQAATLSQKQATRCHGCGHVYTSRAGCLGLGLYPSSAAWALRSENAQLLSVTSSEPSTTGSELLRVLRTKEHSVSHLLGLQLIPEVLDGYKCDRCETIGDASQLTLPDPSKPPRILVLRVARFEMATGRIGPRGSRKKGKGKRKKKRSRYSAFNPATEAASAASAAVSKSGAGIGSTYTYLAKDRTPLDLPPMALSIKHYMHCPTTLLQEPGALDVVQQQLLDDISCDSGAVSNSSSSPPLREYVLRSVVCHSGCMHGGHYIAYARRGAHWYRCDDTRITRCKDLRSESAIKQAYLLFYELDVEEE
eukprot:gnl/Dysnectes_brevis/4058_a5315_712.p1 GENE.gnl/Dysnectes_brevis/4058_a5315_712~~gnl/Dysnectes_brevis/4058_a5315_712.p1  ORF type:complete len:619 (-),score=56.23 gnl/Dysnectes_brevis/4058_a5315_712:73-1929(-)